MTDKKVMCYIVVMLPERMICDDNNYTISLHIHLASLHSEVQMNSTGYWEHLVNDNISGILKTLLA